MKCNEGCTRVVNRSLMLNCRIKIYTGIVLHVYGEIITRQVAQPNKWNEQLERINWKQLKLFIWMICNDGKSIWQSSLTRTYRHENVVLPYTCFDLKWNLEYHKLARNWVTLLYYCNKRIPSSLIKHWNDFLFCF